MNETTESPNAKRRPQNGRLVFYHANPAGNGMAVRFELRLNRAGEDRYDCFFLEMAHQVVADPAAGGSGRRFGRFDWEKKITVKLDFADLCEFLLVLEGRRESAGGRNGLYHQVGDANTLIALKRTAEPNGCRYLLGLSKKSKDGTQIFKGHIVLSEAEATGLRCVLQCSLFFMTFNASLHAPALPA
jgi:hypothetical protein